MLSTRRRGQHEEAIPPPRIATSPYRLDDDRCPVAATPLSTGEGTGCYYRWGVPGRLVSASLRWRHGAIRDKAPAIHYAFADPLTPIGRLTIDGPGVECREACPGCIRQICNSTWVRVTINGITVSAQAVAGSTASSVAQGLAATINSNSTLSPIVFATVSNNVITVSARNAGVEYHYPWNSACSYAITHFSECAFEALRSPNSTLAPQ